MKFGMSPEEAASEPARGGGGGGFIKYCKEGKNVLRILDEPDKWIYFWEHYNPTGFSFPCTRDRDTCPGCTSDVEKMKKASYKVAMNCFDGQYTNVWKFPNQAVGEKLKARYERIGTIRDRDYMITQIKSAGGTDYDVEGLEKEPLTESQVEEFQQYMSDPEQLLAEAYEQSWGDSALTREVKTEKPKGDKPTARAKIKKEEPVEEKVYTESELRAMDPWVLADLCKNEGYGDIPVGTESPDQIVDWMLAQS
jgi:hypothetical protein